MNREYIKIAIRNLKNRSLRSSLSILGIIIGVFLVVSLVSLAQGITEGIQQQLDMIGGDLIMVMPGEGFDITSIIGGAQLKDREIEAIARARGVRTVLESPWGVESVRSEDQSKNTLLWGIDYGEGIPVLESLMGLEAEKGSLPRPGRREVVVGNLIPQDIFSDLRVGDQLTISGRRFTVSGILRSLGSRQDDLSIMMDLSDYREVTGSREGTQAAIVQIESGFNVDSVAENIRMELEEVGRRRRGEEEASYSVITADAAVDIANNIMNILQLAVLAFASIAVFVGAIGIMNSMYTAVRERTKEIGVLKAIGAKRKDISTIFLIESGIIGLIGGIIGIILGIAAAKIGEYFLIDAHPLVYIQAHISFSLIFFTLLFSFLIGCLAGFFPARQAAKKDPVEALMYE